MKGRQRRGWRKNGASLRGWSKKITVARIRDLRRHPLRARNRAAPPSLRHFSSGVSWDTAVPRLSRRPPPPTPHSRGASRLSRAALEIDPAANSGMAQVCRDGARKFTALQMMKIRPLRRRLAPSFGSVARAQPSGVLRPRYSTAWDRPRLSRRLPTLARSS